MQSNISFSFPIRLTFCFFVSFFALSHGASDPTLQVQPQPEPTSGEFGGEIHDYRSIFALAPSSVPLESSYVVLAGERTSRKDPLNGFHQYTGGWNIRDRHYWASAGYTAAPFFAAAGVWFVAFGLALAVLCICYICRKRQPYGYSKAAYAISLMLLVAFSLAAMAGCIILYASEDRFHSTTMTALDYVVAQAEATVGKLREVSGFLAEARQIEVDQVLLPSSLQVQLDQLGTRLNSSSSTLSYQTVNNSDDIEGVLNSMRVALIAVAAVMLSLAFLGFLFSIFGMQALVYILVVIGWIIVTGTFILCGSFLLLHNVAADTCVAMDEWVQAPAAHTALDDIMPCTDSAAAQETLVQSKAVTYRLVEVINEVITNISNINFSPDIKPVYFNQSGPLLPILCNRFHSDLTDRACSPGEVDLNNAAQVWQNYTCQVSLSQPNICTTTGRMTPTINNQMVAAVTVGVALHNYAPFLVELEDCTFVRQTFTEIHAKYCPDLLLASKGVYIGLSIVAVAVMLSVLLWVVYGRERRHRVYSKKLRRRSSQKNGGKDS